jgi:hypothetical protein
MTSVTDYVVSVYVVNSFVNGVTAVAAGDPGGSAGREETEEVSRGTVCTETQQEHR